MSCFSRHRERNLRVWKGAARVQQHRRGRGRAIVVVVTSAVALSVGCSREPASGPPLSTTSSTASTTTTTHPTTTTTHPTTTTLDPTAEMRGVVSVEVTGTEKYTGVYEVERHFVMFTRYANHSDRQIKAVKGLFSISTTDVFGETATVLMPYEFKVGLAPGQVIHANDKFSKIGEEYITPWFEPNQFVDEHMAIWENADRTDATLTITFIPESVVFADGTSLSAG